MLVSALRGLRRLPNYWSWLRMSFFCASLLISLTTKGQQTVDGEIRVPVMVQATKLEEPADYFTTLLLMALNASKADNEVIDIIFSDRDYAQARWVNLAQNEARNFVIWTMTDKEREQQLRPIRIPLCKGLFGYRVLLIRANDQERFNQVQDLKGLAELLAGQGTHWPDTPIMQRNGLRVTTAETTESLFRMINAKRFDYFPRGISEAWFELAQRKEKNLVVEKNIMLYYPAALYFFVNKSNEALAVRIETGLEKLIDSGQFDEFFYHHPRVNFGLENLTSRRVIKLENPFLPSGVPVNNPRYWIDLNAKIASTSSASTVNP